MVVMVREEEEEGGRGRFVWWWWEEVDESEEGGEAPRVVVVVLTCAFTVWVSVQPPVRVHLILGQLSHSSSCAPLCRAPRNCPQQLRRQATNGIPP